jgi:hypothetical protein
MENARGIARLLLALSLLLPAARAQDIQPNQAAPNKETASSPPISISGTPVYFADKSGTVSQAFEIVVTGGPSALAVTIYGCGTTACTSSALPGGTSSGTGNQILSVSGPYARYEVLATFSGGTAPTVTINRVGTTGRNNGGGLPATSTPSLCLNSTSTPGLATWGSCAGPVSSNFSALVADAANISGSTFTIGNASNATTFTPSGLGIINANQLNGTLLASLATGLVKVTTGTGAITVAAPGTDYLTPAGTAAAATALAATPTKCPSGQAPLGVLANGNATGCFTPPGGGPPLGSAAQLPVMNAGSSAYAPVTMSNDCSMTSLGIVTCLSSNGVAFASGAFAAAYVLPTATSSALGGVKPDGTSILNSAGLIFVTPTSIGLGSVTNNAQTFASIMPNTAPGSGFFPIGNSGGTAYVPKAMSGDATLANSGAFTLATVNSNTGSFTCPSLTANGKGLILAASNGVCGASVNSGGLLTGPANFVAGNNTTVSNPSGSNVAINVPVATSSVLGVVSPDNVSVLNSGGTISVTRASIGLGNVTNSVQTNASVMPNTLPGPAQVPVGNSGGTAYAPVTIGGDSSLASNGIMTNVGLGGIPLCTGVTYVTGQLYQYTTTQSPNPCITGQAPAQTANLTLGCLGGGTGQGNTGEVPTPFISVACNNGQVSGSAIAYPYPIGTVVTVTANPTGGSVWLGFQGVSTCNGTTALSCTFTINANTLLSMQFNPAPSLPPIGFQQAANSSGVFAQPQAAADLNVVAISWNDNTSTIASSGVTDAVNGIYTSLVSTTTSGGSATWARVGSAISTDTGSGQHLTCTMNNKVGDLVIIYQYATGSYTPSISDTAGSSWSKTADETTHAYSFIYYTVMAKNQTGNVITVAQSVNFPSASLFCDEYSGNVTSAPLDVISYNSPGTSTTSLSAGNLVTTGANDLITVYCGNNNVWGTASAGTNYTLVPGLLDTSYFNAAGEDRMNLSANTYATPMTVTTATSTWYCTGVAWKGLSATPGKSQAIYYFPNIAAAGAGVNSLSVAWTGGTAPGGLEIKGFEYSGLKTSSVVDGTPIGASGTSTTPSAGSVTTTGVNSLLFTATTSAFGVTAVGAGYTQIFNDTTLFRENEDILSVQTGSHTHSNTISASALWIDQQVAFIGINQTVPTQQYPFTLGCSGNGNGELTCNQGSLDCLCSAGIASPANGGVCSAQFPVNTQIQCTASAH